MEHLTKQQIVLLTLLVSFVTSLATGIITVTLMDQGSLDITQVVNKIEQNVTAAPTPNTVAAVAAPTLAQITAKVSQGIVQFKKIDGTVTGVGIVLSKDGLILTDKAALLIPGEDSLGKGILAVLPGGQEVSVQVVQSEILGDVVFAAVISTKPLTPVTIASNLSSMQLGDSVYALSGQLLKEGILSKLQDRIDTSIPPENILPGTPLFNEKGEILGYKTSSLKDTSSFYSVPALKSITPQLSR